MKLIIFTTHPIQYQSPWFRQLSELSGMQVRVVYTYEPNKIQQGVGFGVPVSWDIPLREGFDSTVLKSTSFTMALPGFFRRFASGLGREIRGFRPDVAMILGWQEVSLVQAVAACKLYGVPVILRGESNALRVRPMFVSLLQRLIFAQCKVFLAIGRSNVELYMKSGVRNEQIRMAKYFVDNDRFSSSARDLRPTRESIRHAWGIPDGDVCFAFVGKLEPKKCVLDFLKAFRLARTRQGKFGIHALVVGAGVELDAARAFAQAHDLPVTFAGFLNQSEIPRAYVAADVLVLPSNYGETWGLVVNEAMATGLPAIVSDRIGVAHDLVRAGKTGVVFPHGDTTALASAIVRMTSHGEERIAMGIAAQELVNTEFTISKAVRATQDACELATERSASRRDA